MLLLQANKFSFFKAIYFFGILLVYCRPADPNYRIKPMLNDQFTGFISREFFQVVVEIPLNPFIERTILEERIYCKKKAILQRDRLSLPILKNVAMNNQKNKNRQKIQDNKFKRYIKKNKTFTPKINREDNLKFYNSEEITHSMKNNKNILLNRGDFNWFLDSMFLYKEDYSDPKKCVFVFRNIQKKLYKKVENTIITQNTFDTIFQPIPGLKDKKKGKGSKTK